MTYAPTPIDEVKMVAPPLILGVLAAVGGSTIGFDRPWAIAFGVVVTVAGLAAQMVSRLARGTEASTEDKELIGETWATDAAPSEERRRRASPEGTSWPKVTDEDVAGAAETPRAINQITNERRGPTPMTATSVEQVRGHTSPQELDARAYRPPAPAGAQGMGAMIKGMVSREGERTYHMPGQASYELVGAEFLFETEEQAQAAGFQPSQR